MYIKIDLKYNVIDFKFTFLLKIKIYLDFYLD